MPTRIAVNACYGGFSLSPLAAARYGSERPFDRADPALIAIIDELGPDVASGPYSNIVIVEIPDDVESWEIMEYDGFEYVAETHRTWHP